MYLDNISRYVANGSIFEQSKQKYRKNCMGPLLLAIIAGIVPGVVLKSFWLYLSIALLVIALSCVLGVYIVSSKTLTLTKSLILDTIIYAAWVSELCILEFMYFTMWKGVNFWILLIYLPNILIPLFAGIKIHKGLRSSSYNVKRMTRSNIQSVGFLTGIMGMSFAAIFRDMDQNVAFIVVLLCFSILNGFMSWGLLSVQKLYYIKKYNLSDTFD